MIELKRKDEYQFNLLFTSAFNLDLRCAPITRALRMENGNLARSGMEKRNRVTYLSESHGCEPAGARFFAVESNDLDPGYPSLRIFGFGVAVWP